MNLRKFAIIDILALSLLFSACSFSLNPASPVGGPDVTSLPGIGELDVPPTFPPMPEGQEELAVIANPVGEVGGTRNNPTVPGDVAEGFGLDVSVIQSIRGQVAYDLLLTENPLLKSPPAPWEYILVEIEFTNTFPEPTSVTPGDFYMTGSNNARYPATYDFAPEPGWDYDSDLPPGETRRGMLSFMVLETDANLLLILDQVEYSPFDGEYLTYLGLDQLSDLDIAISAYPPRLGISGQSGSLESPVPFAQTAATQNWDVVLGTVFRGEEAWNYIQSANQFNDPPPEGMEYIMVFVVAVYYDIGDNFTSLNAFDFQTIGSFEKQYHAPAIVDPDPPLRTELFPGGIGVGWVTVLAQVGEQDVILIFDPNNGDENNIAYLALE